MDLEFLDKSPRMTPLLVRLYDSQKKQNTSDVSLSDLTSAVSDLFNMDLSRQEAELVADVTIQLLRQAEIDLRQALAERLSVMNNIPLRLILQMANDNIAVAGSVLSRSSVLSDLDLIYIIKAKGAAHWQAIAKRPAMSDQIINVLVDTGEEGTVQELLNNTDIRLTEYALDVVSDMACEDQKLAKPLLQREEVTEEIAKRLYENVGGALKTYILEHYDVEASVIDMVDEVVDELQNAAEESADFTPTKNMLGDADRHKEKGLLTMKLMLSTLRRGQIASFIAQFSKFTSLEHDVVEGILKQTSGQGLAIACRAFDINKTDFISIFLLTNSMRHEGKMVDLKDMTKAINYYTKIKPELAKDIIHNSIEEALKDTH